jgi:hypothetical protein
VCHERILERGRSEEDSIPLEYLRDLERLHDEWLLDNPDVTVIDGRKQWTAEGIHDVLLDRGIELGTGEPAMAG